MYYVLDLTGKKTGVETYYILTARTDKQIAAYFSGNSQSLNVAGGLSLSDDLPEEEATARLAQLMKTGKAKKFLILNATDPFPTDWQSENQTP